MANYDARQDLDEVFAKDEIDAETVLAYFIEGWREYIREGGTPRSLRWYLEADVDCGEGLRAVLAKYWIDRLRAEFSEGATDDES